MDGRALQGDKIQTFFAKLFSKFTLVREMRAFREYLLQEGGRTGIGVVLDLRGVDLHVFDAFVSQHEILHRALAPHAVLAIYEQNQSNKVVALSTKGLPVCCALPIPWEKGMLERAIATIRTELDSSQETPDTSSPSSLPVPFSIGESKGCIKKLNVANSFYADRARSMLTEAQKVVRLARTMSQDDESRALPLLGGLLHHAEMLEKGVEELKQFAMQDWHTYQHRTVFDINTVLDAVSSTAIPILEQHGIDLVFEVNNNVPARLKGYPLGIINALVTLLELMTHAGIQDELTLLISLEEQQPKAGAMLNIQFMQNHYRGSVTEVVVSAIQDDDAFVQLLGQMDEIEGALLHTDHVSRGDILQLSFHVQSVERRSYRLPSKGIMNKSILIIDERKKNAEILQKMLRYFRLYSSISIQIEEAIEHIRDHEYDVIIVTEGLAKRCARACKQAQRDEKFIVINSETETNNSFLGLNLADSFLKEPFTHQGIFKAIVDIFSNESLEERMEDLQTLKTYLDLLLRGKRLLIVHNNAVVIRSVEVLLDEMDVEVDRVQSIRELSSQKDAYDYLFVGLDSSMIHDKDTLEPYLDRIASLSKDGKFICTLNEPIPKADLDVLAVYPSVITHIKEPIGPEAFYKTLLDWAMSKAG
jgi:CheY-like chemotaxis protein